MSRSAKKNSPTSSEVPDSPLQWVIVELSSAGEKESDLKAVANAARRLLANPKLEVFIPAMSQGVRQDSHTTVYMEGYAFVQFFPGIQYSKLRETMYFRDVLRCRTSGGPSYALLPDSQVRKMRAEMEKVKIPEFEIGSKARILRGEFKGMRGTINEVYPDKQTVLFSANLGSKPLLVEYPYSFVKKEPS